METVYNKLVRDKIPEIIRGKGQTPVVRILDDAEYLDSLHAKLEEELREYLADGSLEELADLLEVIHAILEAKGSTTEDLESIRRKKAQDRGAFCNRIFLQSVISKD